jgi:hypothetical protein
MTEGLKMRKTISSLVAFMLVAAIAVPVATADKPVKEPSPSDDFTIPASICGFEVMVEILTDKGKAITFGDGRTMLSGALKVRLTNSDDPTSSIVLNISGPGKFESSGVLTATGPWLFFFLPGELGAGSPPILAFTKGQVLIDDTGFHLLGGTRIDLCPVLASM